MDAAQEQRVAMLESVAPATGAVLGAVPVAGKHEVRAAVDEARAVQRLWSTLRARDRGRYMQRAAQAIIDEMVVLADMLCREQGRPRAEVEAMEIHPAVRTLQWLAEEGPGVLDGERVRLSRLVHPFTRAHWSYEPLGVVAVIGPATEPFATPLGDVAVALMAGNGVVLKPSPRAALAGERIARAFVRAGLPEGLLQIVHGHAATGRALVEAPVAQVRFTGSHGAGVAVAEECARSVKRAVLELGGKDVAVVCADANVGRAADGVAWGAFANAGQCGASIERAVAVREISDRFVAAVVHRARSLRCGDPADPATDIGPLAGRERLERVAELIGDAVERGATLECGGPLDEGPTPGGHWCAPAVVTGVTPEMRLWREEAPGPVLAVCVADDESHAIALANDTELGLGASVWTADRYKGARIARELRAGMVWMNDHHVARGAPQIPWGGVRGSGIGRARGAIALRTCAEPKVVTWDPPRGRPAWWFPYDGTFVRAARAITRLRSARDADRERAWREGALPMARVAWRALRSFRRV